VIQALPKAVIVEAVSGVIWHLEVVDQHHGLRPGVLDDL